MTTAFQANAFQTTVLAFQIDGGVVDTGILPGGGHGGSLYWKRYLESLRRKKRKKTPKELLLQELDAYLVDLNARIEEAPPEEIEPEWVADLRRAEAFVHTEAIAQLTSEQIRGYLALVKAIAEEMDDEETILLALH